MADGLKRRYEFKAVALKVDELQSFLARRCLLRDKTIAQGSILVVANSELASVAFEIYR